MVTPADIAAELGRPVPDSSSPTFAQWSMWIEQAYNRIKWRAQEVGVDFDSLDEEKVDYVVLLAVASHVRRPEDATQVTVSVDDASTSRMYQSGAGRVTILDEWWDLLGLTRTSGKAFSLDTAGVATSIHRDICNLNLGANWCSCGADIAGFPIYEHGWTP